MDIIDEKGEDIDLGFEEEGNILFNLDPEDLPEDEDIAESTDLPDGALDNAATMSTLDALDALVGASTKNRNNSRKIARTNAKSVECFDVQGNFVQLFPSGSAAAQALGIAQSDISLCCRFMKESVGGYRFRFHGDDFKDIIAATPSAATTTTAATAPTTSVKLKRGYRMVDASEPVREVVTRTTRASRGEYAAGNARQPVDSSLKYFLAPPEQKARTWSQELVKVGPFAVKKWVPSVPTLNAALQAHKAKTEDTKRPKTSRRGRG